MIHHLSRAKNVISAFSIPKYSIAPEKEKQEDKIKRPQQKV